MSASAQPDPVGVGPSTRPGTRDRSDGMGLPWTDPRLTVLLWLFCLLIFVRNAWVCEDAFITYASAIRASNGDARSLAVTSPPLYLRNRQLRMAPAGEPRGAAATAKDVAVTPRGADVMFAVFWTRRWKRAGVATDAAVGIRDSRSVHADAPVRDASPSSV
jgi:hypothetical protein